MTKTEIFIKISYDMFGKALIISTNCKRERISELLDAWLSIQAGAGEDRNKPINRNVYDLIITLDLSNDTFHWRSDTGNKGLDTGIIMDVLDREDEWIVK